MRVMGLTRLVALALLSVAVWALSAAVIVSMSSAAPRAGLEPGDLVVADQEGGEVVRVPSDGEPEVLLTDLGSVRGVMVLADGSVLAADSDAGAIVGIGGRFGDERVEVATGLEAPEALALATRDRIYVTSFSEGTLSRVDLATGQVETLSAGLDGPAAVLSLRPPRAATRVAVAEWFGGSVAVLKRNGDRAGTLTDSLERPAGLAADGDGTIYVTDRDGGAVVAINRDGQQRTVAEVDRPGGISLDPAQPAAGQRYDLVVATTDGVQRIDPDSGEMSTAADLTRAVGIAVAPDEFITAGATTADSAVEGEGAGAGGDVVTADRNSDIDYTLVGLVALSVVLAGVAIVTGVQLLRSRGDEQDDDEQEGVLMSRKDRRRAEKADRAVQAAERKTAREVVKAEKRAAKMAPPEPTPADAPVAPPAAALFLNDPAPEVATAPALPPDEPGPPQSRRADKAAAKQSAADAKAAAAAAAARARDEAKSAEARAKAEAKQAKAQARLDAQHQRQRDAAAAQQAKADARVAKARAKGDAKADATTATLSEAAATDGGDDAPAAAALLAAGLAAAAAAATPGDDARQPLFASPTHAPQTPGPFLESLFMATGAPSDLAEGVDQVPIEPPLPVVAPARPPSLAAPGAVVPSAAPRPPLALPESTSTGSITDLVARTVAPPHGLLGRRKAKRRFRAAEHRHQQLRAITAITDVPLPAPPTQPGRIELAERGIARAASVASPESPSVPPAIAAGPDAPDAPD